VLLRREDHLRGVRVNVLGLEINSSTNAIRSNVLRQHTQLEIVQEAWLFGDLLHIHIEEDTLILTLHIHANLVVQDSPRVWLYVYASTGFNAAIADENGLAPIHPGSNSCGNCIPPVVVLTLEHVDLEVPGTLVCAGIAMDARVLEVESRLGSPALCDVRVTPKPTLLEARVVEVTNIRTGLTERWYGRCSRCGRLLGIEPSNHVLPSRLQLAFGEGAGRWPVHPKIAGEDPLVWFPLQDVVGAAAHFAALPRHQLGTLLGNLILIFVELIGQGNRGARNRCRESPGGASTILCTWHDLNIGVWIALQSSSGTVDATTAAARHSHKIWVAASVANHHMVDGFLDFHLPGAELRRARRVV